MSAYSQFLRAVSDCWESAPVISRHDWPQVSPQEYDCGCVSEGYVTDRDVLRYEQPFEMRLVHACLTDSCEVMPLLRSTGSGEE